jgi:hypothetical protein
MSGPYQVTREQLTDEQWANLCRIFDLSVRLKRKANERRAALAGK